MKKNILLFFIFFIFSMNIAIAEIDISNLSLAELKDLQQQVAIRIADLQQGNTISMGSSLINNDICKFSITHMEWDEEWDELKIHGVLENKSGKVVIVRPKYTIINGWSIDYFNLFYDVPSFSNMKDYFSYYELVEKTDITSLEDIAEIRFVLEIVESETYELLFETDEIILTF